MFKIYSMTGYAMTEQSIALGQCACEIKSLNNRYLDIIFRLPDNCGAMELDFKKLIMQFINRGRVELTLNFALNNLNSININNPMVESLIGVIKKTPIDDAKISINPLELLKWPGVIENNKSNLINSKEEILEIIKCSLDNLAKQRLREGNEIANLILLNINQLSPYLEIINKCADEIEIKVRKKLQDRINLVDFNVDEQRLEQEILYYTQKMDIKEEIDRIQVHLQELKTILNTGGVVGRKIDFMIQELNREVNTIGSKISNIEVSHAVTTLKVLIEQIREQAQNLE